MLIPAELQRGKVTIFLIFEDEGIDRIKNYDPCNVNVSAIPQHFRDNLTDIIICYGTKEETKAIEDAGREGNFRLMIERIKTSVSQLGFPSRPRRL